MSQRRWTVALVLIAATGCSAADIEHLSVADEGVVASAIRTQAFQQGSVYQGTTDTTLFLAEPSVAHGSEPYCIVKGGRSPKRCLLRWDISSIPSDKTVRSASIRLNLLDPSNATFKAYRVKRDWLASDATWNNATSATAWDAPGAWAPSDRDSKPAASFVGSPLRIAELPVDIRTVQRWVTDPQTNQGLVVGANWNVNDGISFTSSEGSGFPPLLSVSYE